MITYLGNEINSDMEQEIMSENTFGFSVKIKYSNKRMFDETVHNCTEIHSKYNEESRIAFESEIHREGFNREIKDIAHITIEHDTKFHPFMQY